MANPMLRSSQSQERQRENIGHLFQKLTCGMISRQAGSQGAIRETQILQRATIQQGNQE